MKKIVTVGGGTGSYTILSGLKQLPDITLTALVSMADDGGSTGVLRDELGVLPAGDVRQCLVALSEESNIVRDLMSYRFEEGALAGHSFGNIFLAALEKVTGDFVKGVEIASNILKVRGRVIPITQNKVELCATLADGASVKGEKNINQADLQSSGSPVMSYCEDAELNYHAREALLRADIIILGPGNYYCSIIPNLIVKGFKEAIQTTSAIIVFPVNLTNKHGHTLHFKVSDYVRDIENYLGRPIDIILVNEDAPSLEQVEYYQMKEGDGVLTLNDMDDPRVIRAELLSHAVIKIKESEKHLRGFIRHDKDKFAKVISTLL